MSRLRRLATMLAATLIVLAIAAPALATQWSVLGCTFEGTNWLASGNTAYAKTRDVNGACATLEVKLKYKVDSYWYTNGPAESDGSYVQLVRSGADDAAGSHQAWRLGVASGWKNTY